MVLMTERILARALSLSCRTVRQSSSDASAVLPAVSNVSICCCASRNILDRLAVTASWVICANLVTSR